MIEAINELNRFTDEYKYWLIAGFVVVLVLVVAVGQLLGRFKFYLHGNARFSNYQEEKKTGIYGKRGMVIGKNRGRIMRLPDDSHLALISPTRGGKDVAVVIPTIIGYHGSLVIHDKKNELYRMTSNLRELYGQKVWKWSPYSKTTHQYNPLDYVSMDPMEFVASIQTIAFILYPPQYRGESMWSNNSRALFVYMVMLVKESDDMPSTIGEVFRITGGYGQSVADYLQKIIWKRNYDRIEHLNDEGEVESVEYVKKPPYDGTGVPHLSQTCVDGLMSYVSAPKDTGGGILANTRAALQIWASETIDAATSRSDMDLRTIRQVPQSIYLHIPPDKTKQGGLLLTMFYSQLIGTNMNEETGREYPIKVLNVLDEFGSLYLPIVDEVIGECAAFGLFFMLVFQTRGQIEKPPSEGGHGIAGAKNLLGNCQAKIYFTPDAEDSEEISKMLGDCTVKVKSRQMGKPMHGSISEQRRPLMLPQELREMSQSKQIVKIKNCRSIMCKKIVWYKDWRFRDPALWAVSKKLKGKRSPTKLEIQNAADELSSSVPTLDTKKWLADKAVREQSMSMAMVEKKTIIVAATHMDVVKGLNLNDIVVADTEFPEGTSTQEQIDGYLDAFFAVETEDGELVDTETGEVIAKTVSITKTVDITGELDAA